MVRRQGHAGPRLARLSHCEASQHHLHPHLIARRLRDDSQNMWRRNTPDLHSRRRVGSPVLNEHTLDPGLLNALPHVRDALLVKQQMEAQSKHRAQDSPKGESPWSVSARRLLQPISPNVASRQAPTHPPPRSQEPKASEKRVSCLSDAPTASSVYTVSPETNQHRFDDERPVLPLFAGRGRGHPMPDQTAYRRSGIPRPRPKDQPMSTTRASASTAKSANPPRPRQRTPDVQQDEASETRAGGATAPIYAPQNETRVTGPSSKYNVPALDIRITPMPPPPRGPWQGASGAANLMTPIEDMTPATSVAKSGSVSPISYEDMEDTPVAPGRKNTARDVPVSPISDKEPNSSLLHTAALGKKRDSAQTKISTVHGSPGPTMTDFDDNASYRPPVPFKSPMQPRSSSPPVDAPYERPHAALFDSSPATQRDHFTPEPYSPVSVMDESLDEPVIVRSRFSWTTKADTNIPDSPNIPQPRPSVDGEVPDDDIMNPRYAFISPTSKRPKYRLDDSDDDDEPDPQPVSRFSWSTRTTEQPSHLRSPPPRHPGRNQPKPNLEQAYQSDPRRVQTYHSFATDATPIDQNVFAWGSANPYQTPQSRIKTQKVYAPYRDPFTPDGTPSPFPTEDPHHQGRPVSRLPASQMPIVDRIRPLPRRENDPKLRPSSPSPLPEYGAEHTFHTYRPAEHASGPKPIRRKPAPPSILSQDLGPSPPISPPQSPPSVSKELPRAPPELESVDYLTQLEAEISALEIREKNLCVMISRLNNPLATPSARHSPYRPGYFSLNVSQRTFPGHRGYTEAIGTESAPTGGFDGGFREEIERRREQKKKVEEMEGQLADVRMEKQDKGLKLHRAWKRRDQGVPTALWIRRTTK